MLFHMRHCEEWLLDFVAIDCKPGPPTIFSKEEENKIAKYVVDMGFGLTRDDIRCLAFNAAEKPVKNTLFKMIWRAGHGWRGFRSVIPM